MPQTDGGPSARGLQEGRTEGADLESEQLNVYSVFRPAEFDSPGGHFLLRGVFCRGDVDNTPYFMI